jgi:hypothetical protein
MIGAAIGAYLLVQLPGETIKPWIAGYLLLLGIVIVAKGFREIVAKRVTSHLIPLGFFGALIDAIGGGGWGPIVATNLLARGNEARLTIGHGQRGGVLRHPDRLAGLPGDAGRLALARSSRRSRWAAWRPPRSAAGWSSTQPASICSSWWGCWSSG